VRPVLVLHERVPVASSVRDELGVVAGGAGGARNHGLVGVGIERAVGQREGVLVRGLEVRARERSIVDVPEQETAGNGATRRNGIARPASSA
jgi:hypothetical protein